MVCRCSSLCLVGDLAALAGCFIHSNLPTIVPEIFILHYNLADISVVVMRAPITSGLGLASFAPIRDFHFSNGNKFFLFFQDTTEMSSKFIALTVGG